MNLNEYVYKNALTAAEISEKTGISVSTIYRILAGGNMNMKTAREIAKALNQEVTVHALRIRRTRAKKRKNNDSSGSL